MVEGGRSAGGDRVHSDDLRVGAEAREERRQVGDRDAAGRDAVLHVAAEPLGDVRRGLGHHLDRGELDRLQLDDLAHRAIAHQHLQRHRERRDGERDEEAEAVQAIAAALEHPDRVDRRDQKAGDDQGREDEVTSSCGSAGLKIAATGIDRGHLPGGVELEAARRVHPGVRGDDGEGAQQREERERGAEPQVHARVQAIPAEDVDRDEDRLEEEREPLDRERQPEHVAEPPQQARPQQAHLERQHRAGHGTDGEGHAHHLRPAARQPERRLVAVAEAVRVSDQREQRHAETERHEQDVEPERERHLAARREQVARDGRGVGHAASTSSSPTARRTSSRCDAKGPQPWSPHDKRAADSRSPLVTGDRTWSQLGDQRARQRRLGPRGNAHACSRDVSEGEADQGRRSAGAADRARSTDAAPDAGGRRVRDRPRDRALRIRRAACG